jgi:glutamine synthetase
MSLAFPNTVLNTIVAEAIDDLADALESAQGADIAEKVGAVVKDAYTENRAVCFSGDNYSDEWHAEAEQRGLKNLRTTPDALPEVLAETTVAAFGRYDVLSERELASRYEVWIEQYVIRANIEAETTAQIAKTLLLPAALRHLALVDAAGISGIGDDVRSLTGELVESIAELDEANVYPDGVEGLELAVHARDQQLASMAKVREIADRLEKVVADDIWPLPKYSEILFVR